MTVDEATAYMASPYAALHLREGAPRELVEETYWLLVGKLRFGVTSESEELRRLDELNRAYEAIARNGHATAPAGNRSLMTERKRWYARAKPGRWTLDPFETLFIRPEAERDIIELATKILLTHTPPGMALADWSTTLEDAASKVLDPSWRAKHERAAAEDAWAETKRALEAQAEAQRSAEAQATAEARRIAESEEKARRAAEADARRAAEAQEKARRAAEAEALRAAEAELRARRAVEAEARARAEADTRAAREAEEAARAEADRAAAAEAEARRLARIEAERAEQARRLAEQREHEDAARDAAAAAAQPDIVSKWVEMGVAQVEPAPGRHATEPGQDGPRDGSGERVAGGLWGMLEQVLARGERQREIIERENERVLTLRDDSSFVENTDGDGVKSATEAADAPKHGEHRNGHDDTSRPPAFLLIGDEPPAPLELNGEDMRQFTLGEGPNAAKVQLWRRGDSYMLQQISGAPISIGGERLTAPIVVLEDGDEIAHDGNTMRIVLSSPSPDSAPQS